MSDEETEVEERTQTVVRMPPEETVGPFFPSGMSAPEAAMAGATADVPEADMEKIEALREQYGVTEGEKP